MLCLVNADRARFPALQVICELLHESAEPEPTPYVYRDLAVQPTPVRRHGYVEPVRDILVSARKGLVQQSTGGRLPRFPLFTLLVWLMGERIDDGDQHPDRTLAFRVQKISLHHRFRHAVQEIDGSLPDAPPVLRLFLFFCFVVSLLWFWITVPGRVPVISGKYRWFVRQPHLAPKLSGRNFLRFGRRLTDGHWQKEDPEYVCRLLVNAFLEDLRRAYRIGLWKVWRKRRMGYPMLLLDGADADNGGYELLRLVNAVRNQLGDFDPLLLITSGSEYPPPVRAVLSAPVRGARLKSTADAAGTAYRSWQAALPIDRLARRKITWFLPLRIDTMDLPDPAVAVSAWNSLGGYHGDYQLDRPLLWTRRWMRLSMAAILLGGVVGGGAYAVAATRQSHCGSLIDSVTWTGFECVGVADGTFPMFQPSNDHIRQVEDRIADQNRQAAQLHDAYPARPYITLVSLQALTSSNGTADGLTAAREGLEGVAVAQRRQLVARGTADPIVRVLVANAGRGMREGVRVARQLAVMAARDRGIVGVVGLDMSSNATSDTIQAITDAGIPMVASTLSADELAGQSPLYFQVAPQNQREAEVVAEFVKRQPKLPSARVYYSDDGSDKYSSNLREDLLRALRRRGIPVSAAAFRPNDPGSADPAHVHYAEPLFGNAAAAGRATCSYGGVVFFAGRGVPDFGDFVSAAALCGSDATIIGDDDVSRYVADQPTRRQNRALPYYYASFAAAPAPVAQARGVARDFYLGLNEMFGFEDSADGRSLDGHAALAYDASLVFISATAYLRESSADIPVSPGAVWREITAIHTSAAAAQINKHIDGVTGAIDYGGDIARHVPLNKPIAIMRVENGEVLPTIQAFCGTATGIPAASWCPAGP